jgi:hypothetical protein
VSKAAIPLENLSSPNYKSDNPSGSWRPRMKSVSIKNVFMIFPGWKVSFLVIKKSIVILPARRF